MRKKVTHELLRLRVVSIAHHRPPKSTVAEIVTTASRPKQSANGACNNYSNIRRRKKIQNRVLKFAYVAYDKE